MVRLVPTRSSYATPTASTRSSTPSFILRLASNSSSIFKSRNRDRKDITLPDQAASSSTSSSAAATAAATATATSHSTTTTTMALPNILHSPKSSPRTRSRTHTNTGNPPPSTTSPTLRINTLNGAGDNSLSPPVPTFGRSKSLGTGITLAQMGGSAGAAGVGGSGSSTSTSFNALSDAPPLGGGSSSSTAGTTSSSTGSGRRGRSSSILSIHEIKENYDDDLDKSALANLNADWVNYKGAWLIHIVLIVIGKVLVDSIPGIEQDTSWTIVLQGYLVATYIMFHFVEGVPFESNSGVYDKLTMWEQIDGGAQYTPAKKWLTSLPIILFLLSTHYTRYDRHPALFSLNLVSLVALALIPKLPQLHRQRVTFGPPKDHGDGGMSTGTNTPVETAMQRAMLPPLAE